MSGLTRAEREVLSVVVSGGRVSNIHLLDVLEQRRVPPDEAFGALRALEASHQVFSKDGYWMRLPV